jgi:hypothetical protein
MDREQAPGCPGAALAFRTPDGRDATQDNALPRPASLTERLPALRPLRGQPPEHRWTMTEVLETTAPRRIAAPARFIPHADAPSPSPSGEDGSA